MRDRILKKIASPALKINKNTTEILFRNSYFTNEFDTSFSYLIEYITSFESSNLHAFLQDPEINFSYFLFNNGNYYELTKIYEDKDTLVMIVLNKDPECREAIEYRNSLEALKKFFSYNNDLFLIKDLSLDKPVFYTHDFLVDTNFLISLFLKNNVKKSEINIFLNNGITNYTINRYIEVDGYYYRVSKRIINLNERKFRIIRFQNYSKIKEETETLKKSALLDPLTGTYNRKYLLERFEKEKSLHMKYQKSLGLIICDLDNFKRVNDTYGHDFGDLVLKKFAKILKNSVRDIDVVARIGGEEFIVLLPLSSRDVTIKVAERLRTRVESELSINNVRVTASFGATSFNFRKGSIVTFDDLYKKADTALYTAKNSGKNIVVYKEYK